MSKSTIKPSPELVNSVVFSVVRSVTLVFVFVVASSTIIGAVVVTISAGT